MNVKPVYRVGVCGLELRDVRLIEIVFKHSQYNKFEFKRADTGAQIPTELDVDLLVANLDHPHGAAASAMASNAARAIPVVAVVARGAQSNARHAISIDRLTLQLLPILNRVVELEFTPAEPAPRDNAGVNIEQFVDTAIMAQALLAPEPKPDVIKPNVYPQLPSLEGSTIVGGTSAENSFSPNPADTLHRAASAAQRHGTPHVSTPVTASMVLSSLPPSSAPMNMMPSSASIANAPTSSSVAAAPVAASPAASSTNAGNVSAPLKNLVKFPSPDGFAQQQKLRALVVDDSPTVRQQLSAALGKMGLQTETVSGARQALDMLATQHFDIAFVDVVMPEMDGYKLTREIKKNKAIRHLPVAILTSKSSPFDLARGALAGCDTYLTKPVPMKQLEAALVKLLRKSLAIDDLSQMLRLSSATDSAAAGRSGVASSLNRSAARTA